MRIRRRKERQDTLFVPEGGIQGEGDETGMTAGFRGFQIQAGMAGSLLIGKTFRGQKGIVPGVDEKGGDPDAVEQGFELHWRQYASASLNPWAGAV